jgi:Fur family zinc uptake transcriptional regulator
VNARPVNGGSADHFHGHPHEERPHEGQPHIHAGGGGCDHATHRAALAPQALQRAADLCRTRGVRMTPIRHDVLSALYTTHRPLGAYDIAEIMGREAQKRVAPITIYRALEFLLEQGFIHKLETRNAFIACPHAHAPGELVVFLICEQCGGVDEAISPAFSGALAKVLGEAGFKPRAGVVEIAGTCAHCVAPSPSAGGQDSVAQPA